jgi:cytoskeletal protein RodZ
MNGGIMQGTPAGAPTIDVSTFAQEPATSDAPSIDVSLLDVPIEGKQTLPLFALTSDASAPGPGASPAGPTPAPAAKPQPPAPNYARPAPSPSGGSLSPSAVDRPSREGDESPRERKNVVAPATNSTPPAAPGQRRSGLAAPVLLALAVAAGFLIWKRSSGHNDALAQAEQSTPAVEAPRAPAPPAPAPEATLAATPAAPAPAAPADDDITFETAPSKPAAAAAVVNKPSSSDAAAATTPAPVAEKPAVEKAVAEKPAAEPKPEPATPAVKEPSAPSGEPAGPFDRAAASAALNSSAAQASSCRKDGDPSGVASVTITFAPSGRVTSANISGPPFAGTPTGGCIAAALRKARVPAFEGDRVTVSKTVVIQ